MLGILWYGFSQLQGKAPGLLKVYLFEYLHKGIIFTDGRCMEYRSDPSRHTIWAF